MNKKNFFLFALIAFLVLGFATNVNADTLVLEEDTVLDSDVTDGIRVASGKTVTLDLNGHTVTSASGVVIFNEGALTIKGPGQVIASNNYAVSNHGAKLIIDGGTYTKSNPAATNSLISNGWYVNSENTSAAYSEMVINGGSFDGGSYTAIKNDAYGKMTINGGTITSTHSSAGIQGVGDEFIINGGSFDAVIWIQNYTSEEGAVKTVKINGGTFNKAVNIKPDKATGVKASVGHVFIGSAPIFNKNLAIQNTYSPTGTNTFVIDQFDVKNIGGSLSLSGSDVDTKMPAVNLDGMTIGGQLTLSYVEASTIKNTSVKSDISAGAVTVENVTAKTLSSNTRDITQTVKDSNIVWIKEGANHPVTLNITNSTVGKIAPSSNGNTTMYIDTINLDDVTIASSEDNSLATGEFIINGGVVTIKDSSVEKITIPQKSKTDVNVTVEEGTIVENILNNRLSDNPAATIINLPESYVLEEDGTVIMPISSENVTGIKESYTYTGHQIIPNIIVKFNGKTLVEDKDYTVTYGGNVEIGVAQLTIEGKGNYSGTIQKSFKIIPIKIASNNITLSKEKYAYSGTARKPEVTITINNKKLVKGTDYTVVYKNNVNAGTASVVITAKGVYSGTITKTYTIIPIIATNFKVTGIVNKFYNLNNQYQSNLEVTYLNKVLKKGTDYTVVYKNNKEIGSASVIISGKGNYNGKITKIFYIYPVRIAIKNLSIYGNSITVSYYAPAGNVKYQVAYKQYGNKTWKYVNTSYTNYKARYLKYNMKYYFKVRAYKVVNGKTYYGAWSDIKSTTIYK